MADAYQLETSTDRYLLEDGSGVLLLETSVVSRTTSDSIAFSDNVTRMLTLGRLTSDALAITDVVVGNVSGGGQEYSFYVLIG